jgi:hypothetical protein
MMMFNFQVHVKTEGAVAVGCSDLLGIGKLILAVHKTHWKMLHL